MKITKRQLRQIIESYNSMSPRGKALANSIKGKFMRMYPDAKVGIDGRNGFITVNGQKAVNMSQASGSPMSDEEMIEKMHAVYARTHVDDDVGTEARRGDRPGEIKLDFGKDIGTYNYQNESTTTRITKRQLKRIIRESLLSEGSFTYSVIEDADDLGPTVVIKGVGLTFQEMLDQMNGQTITFADGDVEIFEFSDHNGATDAEEVEYEMVRNNIAHHFVEAWAIMNDYTAQRAGGHF